MALALFGGVALPRVTFVELVYGAPEIRQEHVRHVVREAFANYDARHRNMVRVGRQVIRRDDPAAFAQSIDELEYREAGVIFERKAHQRQAMVEIGEDAESTCLLESNRKILRVAHSPLHHLAVARPAEPEKVVILSDDLRCALGEVEVERWLVAAQILHVEDEPSGKSLASRQTTQPTPG